MQLAPAQLGQQQLTPWPQLFACVPHLPAQVAAVESGVQPQTLATPPPLQKEPSGQTLPQAPQLV